MIKPRIVRVFDPTCQRPVWQAWHTHADGTKEFIASSKVGLRELGDRIADWHAYKIIEAKRKLRVVK